MELTISTPGRPILRRVFERCASGNATVAARGRNIAAEVGIANPGDATNQHLCLTISWSILVVSPRFCLYTYKAYLMKHRTVFFTLLFLLMVTPAALSQEKG